MCRDGVIGGQNLIVGLVLLGDGRIKRYYVDHELGDESPALRIDRIQKASVFFRHLMPAPQAWRLALLRRLRCALSSSGE
jgi:hypothetical protein